MTVEVLYVADALATGGVNGRVRSSDGLLNLDFATPQELGGSGGLGTNSEQLLAAGYAVSFLEAINHVAIQAGIDVSRRASVEGNVGVGALYLGGGLEIELVISVPELERREVDYLVRKAHAICLYSKATRGNIKLKISLI